MTHCDMLSIRMYRSTAERASFVTGRKPKSYEVHRPVEDNCIAFRAESGLEPPTHSIADRSLMVKNDDQNNWRVKCRHTSRHPNFVGTAYARNPAHWPEAQQV